MTDLEKAIATKEQAVRDLEHAMSSPGFYDDRGQADKAASEYKTLTAEVANLMQEWEDAQTAAEAHAAQAPPPPPAASRRR